MTKEELKNPITEVVRKNDMRNRHGKKPPYTPGYFGLYRFKYIFL